MKITTLLFAWMLSAFTLHAQLAPDFTVTDTEGTVHQLYADYLDQGKTVMIKIFFTTCPPCNSIAPLMEPFYQSWGAGEYDVEFFEMTDKAFDTDELVEAYAANYGETFPAISVEGGSLETVQPYKSGMFGAWSGTPTFIVIAPDGAVQFDVFAPGNQATINAVDAAIAATGAVKPNQGENPVSVSGQVTFLQSTTGVGNVFVQVVDGTGNVIHEDISDGSGAFTVEVLASEVQPDWVLRAVKNGNPVNGVSAIDLVKIQKHILFIEPFTNPYSKLAADANISYTISALDIITVLKLLLGITMDFPNNQSWIILAADTDFGPPTNHAPIVSSFTIPVQEILSGARLPHFIGIKKGDVDGTAIPN